MRREIRRAVLGRADCASLIGEIVLHPDRKDAEREEGVRGAWHQRRSAECGGAVLYSPHCCSRFSHEVEHRLRRFISEFRSELPGYNTTAPVIAASDTKESP